ncbi:MAG: lipid-A-disaccharide synthase [Bacteroidales bacterium]|nr:lipid-A-disaccharide synthase [Bacteroidales bacterium]MDD4209910.1 lipid-A-disaccharide synthase [Bacteroidales bacterium]
MKYYIITGEASGDLHASNLVSRLQLYDFEACIRAWGGELLEKKGAEVVKNYKDLAFMGFVEVARNLKTILANIRFCKQDILSYQPDIVILVDYPGFNLRIAKFLSKHNIRVFYYISPQVWAWHSSRIKQIKAYVNEMFVILPFEKEFYAKHEINVHYFGHPLLDAIQHQKIDVNFLSLHTLSSLPIIAILPGSRTQEIKNMLPVMLKAASTISEYQFVIAGLENHKQLYQDICKDNKMPIVYNQTYSLLANSYAAMVSSGTATLETALFNVPQVVCYKGNYLSYLIAKKLIKNIKYISLVNLIADKEVVKELIQNDMNEYQLTRELHQIVFDNECRKIMLTDYSLLQEKLGNGNASDKIARKMVDILKK